MKYRNKDCNEIYEAYQWTHQSSIYEEPWKTYIKEVASYDIKGVFLGIHKIENGVPRTNYYPKLYNYEFRNNDFLVISSGGSAVAMPDTTFLKNYEPYIEGNNIIPYVIKNNTASNFRLAERNGRLFLEGQFIITTDSEIKMSDWEEIPTHKYGDWF